MADVFTITDVGPWLTLAIALLIGALVGAERETGDTRISVGLRDLVLASAIAWLCGRLDEPLVTGVVVAGIMALLFIQGRRDPAHVGVTTELSVVSVFLLSFMISRPGNEHLIPIIVALAIVLTILLDAKKRLKQFFHETITDVEFAATVRFLALIFIIYPLLPDQRLGPYEFFHPRSLWLAVILVSGISFVGYFFEKFFGARLGSRMVAILGGLVSTTATTSALADEARQDAKRTTISWQSATLSNAIQFPRLLVLVLLFAPDVAPSLAAPALVAFGVGLLVALAIGWWGSLPEKSEMQLRNPLRMGPALQFAAYLAGVAFVSGWAFDQFGTEALYITSAIGSLLDVDAVTISQADLFTRGLIDSSMLVTIVLIAVGTNMVIKLGMSFINGTFGFFWRMAISFAAMIAAFFVTMLFT